MSIDNNNDGRHVFRAQPIESILSLNPFVVRRRIAFRDCDPAGLVYTPRFLDPIAISAIELFQAELFGLYGSRDPQLNGIDLPAKAVNMVFHNPVKMGEVIDLEVYCSRLGRSTCEFTVLGKGADDVLRFECALTTICIDPQAYKSVPLPDYLREKLLPYHRAAPSE